MLLNYFKIAIRNLWRNKSTSFINIVGLAIGIATCLIIMLFVANELSYDRYNEKARQMVRVYFEGNVQGEKMKESTVMPPVAQTLKNDFPEVEMATRIRDFGNPKLLVDGKSFKEDDFAFVDSNFFQVFTLPLLEGDAKTALLAPYTVVITRDVAKKYFGTVNPIGKTISFKDGDNTPYKVTGIIDKVPNNSHFHFDLFGSMASLPEAKEPSWMMSNFFTYLVLQKGYDYKQLEAKLPTVVEKYIGPQMQQAMGITLSEFKRNGSNLSFRLQPLTDIHLHSDFSGDLGQTGDIRYVYIFGAIALFMLLIACINFMNLSTASASKRSREVGIRKVIGSVKLQLIKQFLLESIVITAIAMLLAVFFIYAALPLFNQLADQQLSLSFTQHPLLIPGLVLFVLFVGIVAGSYPAFYLSSFNPVAVLKGKFVSGKSSAGLRSGLVVFQFFISIILIISTSVVYNQLAYIQHKKLGYNKDQVMILNNTWMLNKNKQVFQQQLSNDPRIAIVSASGYLPAGPSNNNNFFVASEENTSRLIKTLRYDVDENYLATLDIKLLEGRNFSKEFATDSSAVILNETAARAFGWNEKSLGKNIISSNNRGEKFSYHVIGVVKDFHFRSLYTQISPLVMRLSPDAGTLILKVKTKDIASLTASLQKRWAAFGVEDPLSFSFLDDRYNNTYRAERNTGKILGVFAGLTILVACLGLFGLATFTARQRTKEIGVRKVLGASVTSIISMLSKDFLKLVAIAVVIASPIAWYVMNKWLENFAYRQPIAWWVFALAAFAAVCITVITVSYQAIKAAIANPVNSLRSE
jgi:putative ABC transport system permease protein